MFITKTKRLKESLQHKSEVIHWQTHLINQLKDDLEESIAETKRLRADLAYSEYKLREAQGVTVTQNFGG